MNLVTHSFDWGSILIGLGSGSLPVGGLESRASDSDLVKPSPVWRFAFCGSRITGRRLCISPPKHLGPRRMELGSPLRESTLRGPRFWSQRFGTWSSTPLCFRRNIMDPTKSTLIKEQTKGNYICYGKPSQASPAQPKKLSHANIASLAQETNPATTIQPTTHIPRRGGPMADDTVCSKFFRMG